MSRIPEVPADTTQGYISRILEAQAKTWGAPLNNHLLYAHRPELFRAVRGMWNTLDKDGLLGGVLVALINRRVAMLNGCVF